MKKVDYFSNIGGQNLTDSPFYVKDDQATSGYNYEYARTGALQKRRGLQKINSVADTQLLTLGLGLYNNAQAVKTVLRASGTKFQVVDTDAQTFTNQTEDTTTASSDFFSSGSTQPVQFINYTNPTMTINWAAGGGVTSLYGYTGSKVTQNGVPDPTDPNNTFTAVRSPDSLGTWITTGAYYYALVLRKASTQALSNAVLDKTVTIASTTDKVTITFPTGVDTTKYDKWYIYRSAVGGSSGFTTGVLINTVDTSQATYVDYGTSITDVDIVQRAGNVVIDNSPLPTGTYKLVGVYKNQLVTASGSTLYFSDFSKSESWPIFKYITIQGGGDITGIGIVSFNTATSTGADEFLAVFKERQMYLVMGSGIYDTTNNIYDFAVKYVDAVGCASNNTIVNAGGFISWIDNSGIYMWDGSGKPIYVSRPIEAMWANDGDLDKSKLPVSWGNYFRKKKQIIWGISHRTLGENKVQLKLDLRLSLPKIDGADVAEGVFIPDSTSIHLYGSLVYIPTGTTDEAMIVGDDSGFLYRAYVLANDAGEAIDFTYTSKQFDMASPGMAKRFYKVIAWVDEIGPWDLTLDYWTDYKEAESQRSTVSDTLSTEDGLAASLWDVAIWDESMWDDYTPRIKGLTFNLTPEQNNMEGDSIKLRFSQPDADSPVTIHGFSILYEDIAVRK